MKKSIYTIMLVITALGLSLNKASAKYHILSHSATDSCGTGTSIYTTIDTGATGLKLETAYGDGTMDTMSTYGTIPAYAYGYHTYSSPGTYTVKEVILNGSSRVDSITYSYTFQPCGYIWGYLYHDLNSNCVFNSGSEPFISGSYSIEVDSASTPVDTITGCYGYYWYQTHSYGTSFTFKLLTYPTGFTATCPSSHSITATSGVYLVHGGDFGFECSTSSSFDVSISGYSFASKYRYFAYALTYNNSCNPESGTVTINVDSRYSHIGYIWPTTGTVSGNTVSWSYTGLSNDHPEIYEVSAYGDSSALATPGTLDTTTMSITPTSGDADTTNNYYTATDTVRSSWDPNDKEVSPAGNVPAGTTLTYTLKFENTGNAPAMNIHILDTLSGNLDANTFQVISSTAPVAATKFNAAGKTIVKFDFANINLPDSSHHGQADGFVKFSIKTKSSLATGSKVDNQAGIYFDDNGVVMTNLVENTIKPLAIPVVNSTTSVLIYPNPVHGILSVKTNNSDFNSIIILNTLGQELIHQPINSNTTRLDMTRLTPGLYYIMLKGTNGVKVEKVEKL
jgi:uncharacterized repeat protein (TIGR01451 family)